LFYRFKIIIQYDGTNFFGWQLQKNKRTIQGVLEKTLKLILKSKSRIPVHGSGRTDTGVHAWGQVAHADMDIKMDVESMMKAINGNLPKDIQILDFIRVKNDFHSRFNAKKRCYRYQLYNGKSLLFNNQSWYIKSLDLKLLNKLSTYLIGKHDFLSFSKFNKNKINTFCIIFTSLWKVKNGIVYYKIEGNRFLHHMVRYLVATMIAVNTKKITIKEFKALLNDPQKDAHIFKAPSKGLILEEVFYD
jgi:tRNA pseudouridine38-40 synthase